MTSLVVPGVSMSRQSISLSRQGFPKGRIFPIAIEYFMSRQSVAKIKRPCVATQHLCRDRVGQGLDFLVTTKYLCVETELAKGRILLSRQNISMSRQSWPM